MDQPLGMAVGNSLEVREAIETLSGEGPAALTELCMTFGARMLMLGGVTSDEGMARGKLRDAIDSGHGLAVLQRWVEAQGGDPRIVADTTLLPLSPCSRVVTVGHEGYLAGFDAEGVGRAAMLLGAGRATKDDEIDLGAGLLLAVRVGDRVHVDTPLATLYAANEALLDAGQERLSSAFRVSVTPVVAPPLFHEL
ncbi:MAG: pyrimidine-nucleoside phosphorylase, partial [Actinomycetota bacterium]|jgi:pyrimidine-nucleoside phosphorylase|nr:pyrimidine-nucleoside phosphorylase [Actinomycetota bacterium]